jgi:hypothetical protein
MPPTSPYILRCGKLKERNHLKDLGTGGRIILRVRFILGKYDGKKWPNLSGCGKGDLVGCCEYGNELPSFITAEEILACQGLYAVKLVS